MKPVIEDDPILMYNFDDEDDFEVSTKLQINDIITKEEISTSRFWLTIILRKKSNLKHCKQIYVGNAQSILQYLHLPSIYIYIFFTQDEEENGFGIDISRDLNDQIENPRILKNLSIQSSEEEEGGANTASSIANRLVIAGE